jgi:hypothetical protein
MALLDQVSAVEPRLRAPAAEVPRLSFFWRSKWIALGFYGFPFSVGPHPTPVARFRALARRARFAGKGKLFHTLANIAMTLGWPLGACLTARIACVCMRENGRSVPGLRVFSDMIWLALRHSIPPGAYERYRFNESGVRKDIHEYIYWNDLPGLGALNARLGANNRFADICVRNGYAHVPTLAVFDRGRQIRPTVPFVPDAPVLWTKALRLKGGAGGAKWVKYGEAYCDAHGRRVSAVGLANEFRKQDCLVQPFVENHPTVAPITNGALASLRIVTGIDRGKKTEFVTSHIALPHGARATSIGGIFCSIERETGRVRHAAMPNGEPISHHPDTRAPIVGINLPFWQESVELVRRVHVGAFPRFAFLGWDIALTKGGPILLEANTNWDADAHQMLDGPLGHTPFSHLVSQYV